MTDEPKVVVVSDPKDVRAILAYGAGIVSAMATLYGLWKGEPQIYTPGLVLSGNILIWWFATKSKLGQ